MAEQEPIAVQTEEISPKHKIIVESILRGEDGTRTYFDLYDCKDLINASKSVNKLLNKPEVNAYLLRRKTEIASRIENATNASVLRTLQELICIAYVDPINFFDENGNIKKVTQMDEVTRRSISSFKVKEVFEEVEIAGVKEKKWTGTTTEIRTNNKNTALRTIAQYLNMIGSESGYQPPPPGSDKLPKIHGYILPMVNKRVVLPAGGNGNGNGNGKTAGH